ncbi:MAG: hypothetical protein RIF41_02130, partial [Polyangiaceae bacterium]
MLRGPGTWAKSPRSDTSPRRPQNRVATRIDPLTNHRRIALAGILLLPVLTTGCVSGTRAVPSASLRSGCKADAIEVVSQSGHDLVLDVCGTHESWRWHALNG